ncbi:MAG: hypothetical protein ACE5JO_12335 [Candidatus Binatia bacterium]
MAIRRYRWLSAHGSIGRENVMWCQGFSHQEREWPPSREALRRALSDCSEERVQSIPHGNAKGFFRLGS